MSNTRTSFRQAGRDLPGKIYKGNIIDAYNRSTQPSIPAKFELILEKTPPGKDGFGNKSKRFSLGDIENSPGPGQYSPDSEGNSPSFSKKGFLSAFVSNKSRFKRKEYATSVPGPGTYSPSHMRSVSNPVPSLLSTQPSLSPLKNTHLAPGYYDLERPWQPKNLITTFKSKQTRLQPLQKASLVPGPCYYSPNYHCIWPEKTVKSPFKLPLNAKRFKVNLYEPHAEVEDGGFPGPGHYSLDYKDKNTKFGSFHHKGVERFGGTMKEKKAFPGPGAYNIDQKTPQNRVIVGGFGASEWGKEAAERGGHPGPAFYRPEVAAKRQSFLFNLRRKWV